MNSKLYESFRDDEVTAEMLDEASKLFSDNYGVWGKQSAVKAGHRVRITKERLRKEYLPAGISSYTKVSVNGTLAGNAFASRWSVDGRTVCWITQLVVHRDYRERGLACGLLNEIMRDTDDVYGIMSSHPAACLAAAKTFGRSLDSLSLQFIEKHAESILNAAPIEYIRSARLKGSLFDPEDTSGLVSSVDTGFFVDHEEPLEALTDVRDFMAWPLGELIDGHEFVLIVQAKRRARSRSRSAH